MLMVQTVGDVIFEYLMVVHLPLPPPFPFIYYILYAYAFVARRHAKSSNAGVITHFAYNNTANGNVVDVYVFNDSKEVFIRYWYRCFV